MKNINKVKLIGAVSNSPELKYTPTGTAVLEFSLAGKIAKTKNDGTPIDISWYERLSIMGTAAEKLANDLQQGDIVLVDGKLEQQSWEDREGVKHQKILVNTGYPGGVHVIDNFAPDLETNSNGGSVLGSAWAVNEVTISGNTTKDATLRPTTGASVCKVGVAVGDSWKDAKGVWQEKTTFIDVNGWGDLATEISLTPKGTTVYAEGSLARGSFDGKDGKKVYTAHIEVSKILQIVRPPSANADNADGFKPQAAARTAPRPATRPAPVAPVAPAAPVDMRW